MHEAALALELVRALEEAGVQRGFRRVLTVWAAVGQRRGVEPDALRFAFEVATRGTLAEGARLELALEAARGFCFACGQEVELEDPTVRCARCGSGQTKVTGGDELSVQQIEVE